MSADEEFRALLRQQTLDAFDLKAWQIDPAAPAPWHERLRRPFRRMRYRLRAARRARRESE